jgi:transcriptional regulator with XRE-family HTH domain
MSTDTIAFGRLLRIRRNAALLTLEQLASLARLSDSTIKMIERGKTPSIRTLAALLSVPELRLAIADLPEPFRSQLSAHHTHASGVDFLRFTLTLIDLSTREQVLQSVICWARNQRPKDGAETLDGIVRWAEGKRAAVHSRRSQLLLEDRNDGLAPMALANCLTGHEQRCGPTEGFASCAGATAL